MEHMPECNALCDGKDVHYLMEDNCTNCNQKIQVMAFRGTGFCCVDCKKKAGIDVGSQGTLTFLTREERQMIKETRNGK